MTTSINIHTLPVTPPGWTNASPLFLRRLVREKIRFTKPGATTAKEYSVRLPSGWFPPAGRHKVELTLYAPRVGEEYLLATPIDVATDPYWAAGRRLRNALLTPSQLEKVGYTKEFLEKDNNFRKFGFTSPNIWWHQGDVIVIRMPGTGTPVYCHGISNPERVNDCVIVLTGDRAHAMAFPLRGQLNIQEVEEAQIEVLDLDMIPFSLDASLNPGHQEVDAVYAAGLQTGVTTDNVTSALRRNRESQPLRSDDVSDVGEVPADQMAHFLNLIGQTSTGAKAVAKAVVNKVERAEAKPVAVSQATQPESESAEGDKLGNLVTPDVKAQLEALANPKSADKPVIAKKPRRRQTKATATATTDGDDKPKRTRKPKTQPVDEENESEGPVTAAQASIDDTPIQCDAKTQNNWTSSGAHETFSLGDKLKNNG